MKNASVCNVIFVVDVAVGTNFSVTNEIWIQNSNLLERKKN